MKKIKINKFNKSIPHVVIIGAGFGGLRTARKLAGADMRITLIDRNNYHLFQPLLYQVATAGLAANEIAYPLRGILRKLKRVHRWKQSAAAEIRLKEILKQQPG